MENLMFSLNATVPVFLMMILGLVFKKIGWIDDVFASKMNTFVFRVALPVMVFSDLATVNLSEVWNIKFVLFCFMVTVLSISISAALSFLWKDKSIQGEFIQASYRSSAALLGIAFIQNIYGNSGMAPLMIVGTVPLYNIMAVVVLSLMKPDRGKMNRQLILRTLKGIVTNPILIGIVVGMVWSLLKVPMPVIFQKTLKNVATLASPLGLMAMGAAFEIKEVGTKLKPAVLASVIKLVVLAAVFLPVAVGLGFREEK